MHEFDEDGRKLRITEENDGDGLIALKGTENKFDAHVEFVEMQTNLAMLTEYAEHEGLASAKVEPCIY